MQEVGRASADAWFGFLRLVRLWWIGGVVWFCYIQPARPLSTSLHVGAARLLAGACAPARCARLGSPALPKRHQTHRRSGCSNPLREPKAKPPQGPHRHKPCAVSASGASRRACAPARQSQRRMPRREDYAVGVGGLDVTKPYHASNSAKPHKTTTPTSRKNAISRLQSSKAPKTIPSLQRLNLQFQQLLGVHP